MSDSSKLEDFTGSTKTVAKMLNRTCETLNHFMMQDINK